MTTRAAAKSKSKKPLETTLGRAPSYSSDDPIDLSHIRKPIDTSIFGLSQVLALFETATDEVRRYVTYECDIMYECRMCRTIFRSLANFILHKRNYCRETYNQNDHTNCRNNCQENEFHVMQEDADLLIRNSKKKQTSRESSPVSPECDSKPSQAAEIVHPDADPTHPEPKDKKNLSSVLCRLLSKQQSTLITEQCLAEDVSSESQGSEKEETKSNVSLQAIGESTSGVFQTMFRNMIEEHSKMDFMNTQVLEIHDILENNEAILGFDGRIVTSDAEKSRILKNNFMCTVCNQKFSTKKTLTYHINYKHNNTRQVYKCTECEDTFANTWGVFRHLYKIHRKTPAQVKRLRNQIHANRIRKNEQPEQKDSSNGKTSCKSSADPQGKLDENQQWMDDLEGDNDLQRCGGCGRKFERKAALHSHSQFCTKRIAVCNTIKGNSAKRVQSEEKPEKVKSSKVATTNNENGTNGARRRKPLIAQRLCRIDYFKETNAAKNTSDNNDYYALGIKDSPKEVDTYNHISKDDIIRIIHTDDKTNDVVAASEQNEIIDSKDDCREIEEIAAEETDVVKPNIDIGYSSMLELKEVAKETDDIKSDIDTNDGGMLETKEIAAKETDSTKSNIGTDDAEMGEANEMIQQIRCDSRNSNSNDAISSVKLCPSIVEDVDESKSAIETKLDSSDNNIVTRSKTNIMLNLNENNCVLINESMSVDKDINILEPVSSEEVKPVNILNQEPKTSIPMESKMESHNIDNDNTHSSADTEIAAQKSIIQARCIYLPQHTTQDGKRKVDDEVANLQPENTKRKKVENSIKSDNKGDKKTVVGSPSKIKAKITLETKSTSYIDKEKHICLPCKKVFKSNKSLLKHMAVHFNWYRYQCRCCQFMSYNRSKCDRHAEKVHDAHDDAMLKNFVLHIPIWKTVELSTNFRRCCKRGKVQDVKTHNLGNTMSYKNEKWDTTKVQKDLTVASASDEQKMESSTSVASDENSSVPDAQDPSVRKMIMEVIFGTDVGSLSHSDVLTSSVQNQEVSRLEPSSESNNLHTSKEILDLSDNQNSVEEPSTVLRDNSRPVRNRTVPVQKDFLYDMKHILKPKSAKEKELHSEDSHKEGCFKKQKPLKIYTKKSKPKLKRPEPVTPTNSGEPHENKNVSSAAIDLAQDINMNSKDIVKKHVAGDCV